MVSVETKSDFFNSLKSQPQTAILVNWLLGLEISYPSSDKFSDANNASHAAMYSIQADRKDIFEKAYQTLCLRKPNKDTPYVFNDILIFSFVCGVVKFKLDQSWLQKICNIRMVTDDVEMKKITQSYLDILSDDQNNLRNYCEIGIVCNHLCGNRVEIEEIMNHTYVRLSAMTFPFYRSHFLNAIALRAMDLIISKKKLNDVGRYENAIQVKNSFENQTNFVARACWFLLTVTVAVLTVRFVIMAFHQINSEKINKIVTALSFLGLGGVGSVLWGLITKRKRIITLIEKLVAAYWGYIIILTVIFIIALILFKIGLRPL